MKKIYLSLKGIDLGYLCESNIGFTFVANEDNIKLAEEKYIAMQMFKINKKGSKSFSQIPNEFLKFLPSKERKDLIEKANLLKTDSQFEILYKLAKLNIMEINFKIHQ